MCSQLQQQVGEMEVRGGAGGGQSRPPWALPHQASQPGPCPVSLPRPDPEFEEPGPCPEPGCVPPPGLHQALNTPP